LGSCQIYNINDVCEYLDETVMMTRVQGMSHSVSSKQLCLRSLSKDKNKVQLLTEHLLYFKQFKYLAAKLESSGFGSGKTFLVKIKKFILGISH
jgi:hypothetical protein